MLQAFYYVGFIGIFEGKGLGFRVGGLGSGVGVTR